jgi:tetratricopeptide (TPR) repeat protein
MPFAAIGVLGVVAWLLLDFAPRVVVDHSPSPTSAAPTERPTPAGAGRDELPPFQQLERERARKVAQDELARFVELEIRLRDELHVEGWGQAQNDTARLLAQAGDEAFVGERFDVAIASYRDARAALEALIADGEARFAQALVDARQAIDARDAEAADEAIHRAQLVHPDHPTVQELARRAGLIPEIVTRLRTARNQELQERWNDAVDTYESVRTLDPATVGLDELIARARDGATGQGLEAQLSQGFAALEQGRLDTAKTAFANALRIDPGNLIALGGQQQAEEKSQLLTIRRLQDDATGAERGERWTEAAAAYQRLLELDANLQFARSGKTRADTQARTLDTLERIAAQPERLSSDQLYADATRILERARGLVPRGPTHAARIDEVAALLEHYATPVPVVLRSDNATDVTLSTVGRLGRFDVKQLELRPGAYTLIGSRDGCRDVRANITVRPSMEPVDIRCEEQLTQ